MRWYIKRNLKNSPEHIKIHNGTNDLISKTLKSIGDNISSLGKSSQQENDNGFASSIVRRKDHSDTKSNEVNFK